MRESAQSPNPAAEQQPPLQIEQRRAWHAAEQLRRRFDRRTDSDFDTYSQLARKLPSMLVSLGLGQTVAFLRAKGKSSAHRIVLEQLEDWLVQYAPVAWTQTDNDRLWDLLTNCSTKVYYQALGEAVAYAGWLKRLAEARAAERGAQARPVRAESGSEKPSTAPTSARSAEEGTT